MEKRTPESTRLAGFRVAAPSRAFNPLSDHHGDSGSHKRARRGLQPHGNAASSKKPARQLTDRPTAAEKTEAEDVINVAVDDANLEWTEEENDDEEEDSVWKIREKKEE